jgi:hypothetical protein
MSWVTRAAHRRRRAATVRPSALGDAFVDSWVSWREASEDVRTAYRWWNESAGRHRGLAFERYRVALDCEQHAASIHAHWVQRVRAYSS